MRSSELSKRGGDVLESGSDRSGADGHGGFWVRHHRKWRRSDYRRQNRSEGADCQFTRENLLIARVNPTPGVMHVGKAAGGISVQCRLEGYQDTVGSVASEFQAATLGNIILGGLIGVVVDAASGAMSKYPESVTFTLVPLAFKSAAERDHIFRRTENDLPRGIRRSRVAHQGFLQSIGVRDSTKVGRSRARQAAGGYRTT
jgi:hypothetical protein